MNSRQSKPTVNKDIPPRKFPKQQYQKLTRHFWTITVVIVAVICVAGGLVWTNVKPKRSSHQATRPARTERPAKRIRTPNRKARPQAKPLSTKQGEKLLGHWLIKLHYPTAKNRDVLSRYQKSNPQQDARITKRLSQLSQSKTSNANRQNRIRQFIDHQFK